MNKQSIILIGLLLSAGLAGCRGDKMPLVQPQHQQNTLAERRSRADVGGAATAIADSYVITLLQGLDQLHEKSSVEEVQRWASENKLATALAAYTNATGPNEMANLLDILTYVTLKRAALEEHWIPTLLHEQGEELLQTYRTAEDQAWKASERVLMPSEIEDLRKVIIQWQKDNPKQYYVANVRFAELAKAQTSQGGHKVNVPGNIFGLLYMDPLAGLDPLAREVREVRQLSERMMFLMTRAPIILGLEADVLTGRVLGMPEIRKVALATEKVGSAAAALPEQFSNERKAAIEQLSTEFGKHREGIVNDLDRAGNRIDRSIDKTDSLLIQAQKTGASVNESTRQTVTVTEESLSRIIHRIFLRVIGVIVLLLIGIPLAVLGYRWGRRRLQMP